MFSEKRILKKIKFLFNDSNSLNGNVQIKQIILFGLNIPWGNKEHAQCLSLVG